MNRRNSLLTSAIDFLRKDTPASDLCLAGLQVLISFLCALALTSTLLG